MPEDVEVSVDQKLGAFSFLTRRRLLKLGVAGLGLATAGGGLGVGLLALRGSAPKIQGLSRLTDQEYRTLTCIAAAHLPQGGAFELGALDFDLPRLFDEFLLGEQEDNVSGFKTALALLEYGPLIYERRLVTFSNLAPPEQAAHWEAWNYSDNLTRRQVAFAFRGFLSMMFFDEPAVWTEVKYPGPKAAPGALA